MPFKSDAQRAWMYSRLPKLAEKWQAETPKKDLPPRVQKRPPPKKQPPSRQG